MESKRLPTWKERSLLLKGLTVFGAINSLAIIILVIAYISGVWKNSTNIFESLIGVSMVIQWLQYRKYNKFVAYLSLSVAIFIFTVLGVILFIH